VRDLASVARHLSWVFGHRRSVFPSLSTPEDVVGLAGRRRIVRGGGDTERD